MHGPERLELLAQIEQWFKQDIADLAERFANMGDLSITSRSMELKERVSQIIEIYNDEITVIESKFHRRSEHIEFVRTLIEKHNINVQTAEQRVDDFFKYVDRKNAIAGED